MKKIIIKFFILFTVIMVLFILLYNIYDFTMSDLAFGFTIGTFLLAFFLKNGKGSLPLGGLRGLGNTNHIMNVEFFTRTNIELLSKESENKNRTNNDSDYSSYVEESESAIVRFFFQSHIILIIIGIIFCGISIISIFY